MGSITKRERVSRHVSECVHVLSFIFSLVTLNLIRAGTLISPPLGKVTTVVRPGWLLNRLTRHTRGPLAGSERTVVGWDIREKASAT